MQLEELPLPGPCGVKQCRTPWPCSWRWGGCCRGLNIFSSFSMQDGDVEKKDPFEESGLTLSPTAAEAKEKVRAKRVKKRAPQMDWNKKREIFSNF